MVNLLNRLLHDLLLFRKLANATGLDLRLLVWH
jgi:hypothetical protein